MVLTEIGLAKVFQRVKSFVVSQLNSKASVLHTHTSSDITDLPDGLVVDSTLDGTSSNAISNSAVTEALDGKSNTGHTHTKSQITDFPALSTVATSGSYNDLSNKPTTMAPTSHTHGNITNNGKIGSTANKPLITTTGGTVTTGSFGTSANTFCEGNDSRLSDARTPTSHTHIKSEITDFPTLATVATSGSYNDLDNKPTIPTVNNATLTIQKNGTTVKTFTANASSNVTANITVPTKTSELANDSGFLTGVSWDNVSGKPSSFTPYFANNTWYAVGDDAAIGDHNVGGGLGVKALNSTTTRIDLCYKDDASNYKSITYDGTTLYMNGNCDYATNSGRSNSSGYADSAGGVAWGNVSGRPTALSQFTNDSGFLTSADRLPIGSYIQFAGSQAPEGFLVCNGGEISRTTYSALFAVIGTTYGNGDGSSTFNLPNLTDRFLQGSTSVGTVKNAGLPNISGCMHSRTEKTVDVTTSKYGALYTTTNTYEWQNVVAQTDNVYSVIYLDASRSNSIYGNSTTVQPPALTCLICIKY